MLTSLTVSYHGRKVGTLKCSADKKIYFKYDEEWIQNGFSISPISLPLTNNIFVSNKPYFNGLFGVFADSFVDSWGELVIQKYLKTQGINYNSLNILEKLSYIGNSTMGALEYKPTKRIDTNDNKLDLDEIQISINNLLNNKDVNSIDEIFKLGGSSSGTRPKILTKYNGRDVIIKFASKFDPSNIVEIEYRYMQLAKEVGINIPYIELIETKNNKYFLIERFDRKNNERIHMISVSGLLDVDHNVPSLDYLDLLKLTRLVTQNQNDVIEMFRRMVFNVYFKNLDDHTKNFSFLYNEETSLFELSPAYDLTPGQTYFGEHTTSINGKGKDITDDDLLFVAEKSKIDKTIALEIINKIKEASKKI